MQICLWFSACYRLKRIFSCEKNNYMLHIKLSSCKLQHYGNYLHVIALICYAVLFCEMFYSDAVESLIYGRKRLYD